MPRYCYSFAVRLGLAVLLAATFANSSSAAAPFEPEKLSSDQLIAIRQFLQQANDLANWRCKTFKAIGLTHLADGVADVLSNVGTQEKLDALHNQMADPADRTWLPECKAQAEAVAKVAKATAAAEKQVRGQLGAAAAESAVDQAVAAEIVKQVEAGTLVGVTVDPATGLARLNLSAELAEAMLAWNQAHAYLAPALARLPIVRGQKVSTEVVRQAIVDALLAYEADQRSVARLELLASQEAWVFDAVGTDAAAVRKAIAAYHDAGAVGPAEMAKFVDAVKQVRSLDAVLAQFCASRVGQVVTERLAQLAELLSLHQIDLDVVPGRAFLRVIIDPPQVPNHAVATEPIGSTVHLYLCKPIVGSVKGDSTGLDQHDTAGLVEQIDLGVTVRQVKCVPANGTTPPLLSLLPVGNGARVTVDDATVRAAVQRLGVPPGIDVASATLNFKDFNDVTIVDLKLRPPAFTGLLGSIAGGDIDVPPIRLNRDGMTVDWQAMLNVQVLALKKQFESNLPKEYPLGPELTLVEVVVDPATNWMTGPVRYTAKLRVKSLTVAGVDLLDGKKPTISVPVTLEKEPGGTNWSLSIRPHLCGAELLTPLRAGLARLMRDQIGQIQPGDAFNAVAEQIDGYASLDALTVDPATETVTGTVRFSYPLPVVEKPVTADASFTASLKTGHVTVNFDGVAKAVRESLKSIIADLAKRSNLKLGNAIRDQVNGMQLTLFGQPVTLKADFIENPHRLKIDADGSFGGKPFSVHNIFLRTDVIQPDGLKAPDLDFGSAQVDFVVVDEILKSVSGFGTDWLTISQPRWTAGGLVVCPILHLSSLGTDLPLGELTLGVGQVKFTAPDVQTLIQSAATRLLNGKSIGIGDVGPLQAAECIRFVG